MTVCSSDRGYRRVLEPGLSRYFLIAWVPLLLLDSTVDAQMVSQAEDKAIVKVESTIAMDGYVFVDGEYLPPPYRIERRGNKVSIDDRLIPTEGLFASPRPDNPEGFRGTNPIARRQSRRPRIPIHARIRDKLHEGVMLAVWGQQSVFLDDFDTASVLDILLRKTSVADRTALLTQQMPVDWITAEQWQQLSERFQPTDELADRAGQLISYYRADLDGAATMEWQSMWRRRLSSGTFSYVIIVSAMLFAVIATGNLLNVRPDGHGRWSELHDSIEKRQMVTRNITLIVVLSVVDLLLTLSAQQSGAMMELNPFGSHLVSSPAMLAVFKLATLVVVCGILFGLRRYRGAQVASWWMCLVCTLLTFRWVTFNSLFVS